MPAGYVIAESIRAGSRLEGFPLTLIRIERHTIDNATGAQPSAWTMIHFDFPKDDAARLADALADVLDEPGWYTNFDVDGDKVVIFPRRVMRYRRGDQAARAAAEAYARSLGIPDAQLDW
jgi:hypothetical protein